MDVRAVIGYVIVGVVLAILAGFYQFNLGEATKRERLSACNALGPTPFNEAVGGQLPVIAPKLEAQSWDGKTTDLASYRGKVVFVNFWGDWCQPCIDEMPAMDQMARQLVGDDFVVLAIASGTTWKTMTDKLAKLVQKDTRLTLLLDTAADDHDVGPVAKSWGTSAYPETFLIDKEGKVRYYFVNKRDWHSARAMQCLQSLIEE